MSLTQALSTAVSGLRATQTGLSIVASNVANAETPGYVRKTPAQVSTAAGAVGVGVRVAAINRELDQYIQRQMRVEGSGAAYASLRAQFYDRLQDVYGVPGAVSTLENAFNELTTAFQALSVSPESPAARSAAVTAAQVMAQQLNGLTTGVQGLRSDAELGLADAIEHANDAMRRIAQINQQLANTNAASASTADLLDQRDRYIDELSRLMDINVVSSDHNQVTVFTNSGIQLVGLQPSVLAFDAQGSSTPASRWDPDPAKRNLGTIVLKGPNGGDVDLIAGNAIRSGEISALIEMRDDVLVQAQTQLDEIAAALARTLSDRTIAGTPATSGAQTGLDVDLGSLLNGNSVRLSYTDTLTGLQQTVTLVRVDDPAALPLKNSHTNDPNDRVIGLDFSGGLASVVSQLNGKLGSAGLTFANPSGSTLRVLDDGTGNRININALSASVTASSLTGGTAELPLFVDGNALFTGAAHGSSTQTLGLAGRITVNASLLADPSRLVVYQTSPATAAGDATRPNFIYDRLTTGTLSFAPSSGVGTASAPFTGSVQSFMRQVISRQGEAADAAANLSQGQDVVYNALRQRFDESAGVNIDQELTNLLNLQNAYAANARVMATVKEMLETLMRM